MAQKRMFDLDIVRSDRFLDMGLSTQALYFHLGMNADDEGFVSPKFIMRMLGAAEDELKILAAKEFVILFKTGVVVITDWKQNNYLDKNRIKPTQYQEEKKQLSTNSLNQYVLNLRSTDVKPTFNQYSIEESSIDTMSSDKQLDFDKFLKFIDYVNSKHGRKLFNRVPRNKTTIKARKEFKQFKKLLSYGYKGRDFMDVADRLHDSEIHVKSNYKHLTIELMLRPQIFERELNSEI